MKVSEIRVWKVNSTGSLKAKADVAFVTDLGEFSVKGFRVVQAPAKGAFVAPPQEKYQDKSGKAAYKDILWLGQSLQQALYTRILDAYNRELGSPGSG